MTCGRIVVCSNRRQMYVKGIKKAGECRNFLPFSDFSPLGHGYRFSQIAYLLVQFREIISESAVNGIDTSGFSLFRHAGFPDPVYLGIIGNSPRIDSVLSFISFLAVS